MNGINYLLDTNAIVELLQNNNHKLLDNLNKAQWVGISIISKLEFLAFPNLTKADEVLFRKFINKINIINLNNDNIELIDKILAIRKNYKMKLPDSIISATAILSGSILISRDKDFKKIKELKILDY